MARFMLKGPPPCKFFLFYAIHYDDQVTRTFLLISSSVRTYLIEGIRQTSKGPKSCKDLFWKPHTRGPRRAI